MATKTYNASCHCSAVRFTAAVSPPLEEGHEVTSCNCSICSRNGYLWIYVPESNITWESGKDSMTTYTFNNKFLAHNFCPTCGTSVCGVSLDPNIFPGITGVNVRTFEGVDIDALKIKKVDTKDKSADEVMEFAKGAHPSDL